MGNRLFKKKVSVILSVLLCLWIGTGCALFMAEMERITEAGEYEVYLGAEGKYKENYVGYNDIFPDSLENVGQVKDFVYYYYNPWDANYFGYMVCEYSDEEFEKEFARLNALESSPYEGVYGIESFPYELGAVYADEVYGVIYALADKENHEIVYVALEFCNYFTDIEYEEMMDVKYLPKGFNAMPGNETRKAFDRG